MAFLVFVFWLAILLTEGYLLSLWILGKRENRFLLLSVALPLASLTNILLTFVFTLMHLPLLFLSCVIGHCILIAFLFLMQKRVWPAETSTSTTLHQTSYPLQSRFFVIVCSALLIVQGFFSVTHAVILPTYHIDSLTNWTMRSEVSFYDHAIAFDPTEIRGVAKPQYPFLFHALQIIVNEGNAAWNDRSANSILFLLTLSSFAALFLFVQSQKGTTIALLSLALLTSIPLLSVHLSQGYADLPLTLFLCLSFVSLWVYRQRAEKKWLMMSALFVGAAAWTKTEGLIVGLVPWILLLAPSLRLKEKRTERLLPILTAIVLSISFPILLLFKGMQLTPHQSDTHFQWNSEAFSLAMSGLFASGSMGVVWFALFTASAILFILYRKKDPRCDTSTVRLLAWPALSLAIVLGTYIFTPNAAFLQNGESYYRQLMIPASLWILWCIACWNNQARD